MFADFAINEWMACEGELCPDWLNQEVGLLSRSHRLEIDGKYDELDPSTSIEFRMSSI